MTESNSENQNGINKPEITVENIGKYRDDLERRLDERKTPDFVKYALLYTIDYLAGWLDGNSFSLSMNDINNECQKLREDIEYKGEETKSQRQELDTVSNIYMLNLKNPYSITEQNFITEEDKRNALLEEIIPYLK